MRPLVSLSLGRWSRDLARRLFPFWAMTTLAILYVIAGTAGLSYAVVNPSATALWPPAGIALAFLLLFGSRVWPGVFAGAFVVNLHVNGLPVSAFLIAVGNTLEAVIAAFLVRRFAHGDRAFEHPRDICAFTLVAGLLAPAVSATVGTTTLCLGGNAAWPHYGLIWLTWWVGDGAGALLFGPALVLWVRGASLGGLRPRVLETGAMLLSILLMGYVLFGGLLPSRYHLGFLLVPVLLWPAFRFGPRETALAVVVLTTIAISGTMRGVGPFAFGSRNESLLLLHVFLATAAGTILSVAALVAERRRITEEQEVLLRAAEHARARLEAAHETQSRLAAIVEGSDDAIISKTLDGVVTSWNPAAEQMFGFAAAEAIGRPIALIVPPERQAEEAEILSHVRRGEAIDDHDTVRVHKSGTRVDTSLTVSPVRNEAGAIVGASTIARNISQRRRDEEERQALLASARAAQAEAEAANRAKDEFLALLAHELRNPLGAIGTAAQVIETAGRSEEQAARAVQIITRQVRHLASFVDDLLDVGRVITGKIVLDPRPLNFAEAVERCLGAWHAAGKTERHQVRVESEPVWVEADEARLEQIISNLVENALRYTPPGGQIHISLRRIGSDAVLQVADNGIGIPRHLLPRVFDLFVQGDRTLERAPGGLGVGLTLVRRLVELHGGTVEAASEGVPGRGSAFTVRLPSTPVPLLAPRETVSPRPPSRRRRVLLVEDNRDSREALRTVLESDGHEVHEAEDGLSGLAGIRRAAPDIAFIDVGLPRLDGYEVAKRVRAEPGRDAVVLVALTGYGSSEDRQRAQDAGFDTHLVKPVTREQLARVFEDAEHPRVRTQSRA